MEMDKIDSDDITDLESQLYAEIHHQEKEKGPVIILIDSSDESQDDDVVFIPEPPTQTISLEESDDDGNKLEVYESESDIAMRAYSKSGRKTTTVVMATSSSSDVDKIENTPINQKSKRFIKRRSISTNPNCNVHDGNSSNSESENEDTGGTASTGLPYIKSGEEIPMENSIRKRRLQTSTLSPILPKCKTSHVCDTDITDLESQLYAEIHHQEKEQGPVIILIDSSDESQDDDVVFIPEPPTQTITLEESDDDGNKLEVYESESDIAMRAYSKSGRETTTVVMAASSSSEVDNIENTPINQKSKRFIKRRSISTNPNCNVHDGNSSNSESENEDTGSTASTGLPYIKRGEEILMENSIRKRRLQTSTLSPILPNCKTSHVCDKDITDLESQLYAEIQNKEKEQGPVIISIDSSDESQDDDVVFIPEPPTQTIKLEESEDDGNKLEVYESESDIAMRAYSKSGLKTTTASSSSEVDNIENTPINQKSKRFIKRRSISTNPNWNVHDGNSSNSDNENEDTGGTASTGLPYIKRGEEIRMENTIRKRRSQTSTLSRILPKSKTSSFRMCDAEFIKTFNVANVVSMKIVNSKNPKHEEAIPEDAISGLDKVFKFIDNLPAVETMSSFQDRLISPFCEVRGHSINLCPDKWRRYHSTTTLNCYPNNSTKPNLRKICCVCGKMGHHPETCRKRLTDYPIIVSKAKSHVKTYCDLARLEKRKGIPFNLLYNPKDSARFHLAENIKPIDCYRRFHNAVGMQRILKRKRLNKSMEKSQRPLKRSNNTSKSKELVSSNTVITTSEQIQDSTETNNMNCTVASSGKNATVEDIVVVNCLSPLSSKSTDEGNSAPSTSNDERARSLLNSACEVKMYLTDFHSSYLLSPKGQEFLRELSLQYNIKARLDSTSVGHVLLLIGFLNDQDEFYNQLLVKYRELSDNMNNKQLNAAKVPKKSKALISLLQANINQLNNYLGDVNELHNHIRRPTIEQKRRTEQLPVATVQKPTEVSYIKEQNLPNHQYRARQPQLLNIKSDSLPPTCSSLKMHPNPRDESPVPPAPSMIIQPSPSFDMWRSGNIDNSSEESDDSPVPPAPSMTIQPSSSFDMRRSGKIGNSSEASDDSPVPPAPAMTIQPSSSFDMRRRGNIGNSSEAPSFFVCYKDRN